MGIAPIFEYGLDCTWCHAAANTPKYIYASFSGVEICPGAPPHWRPPISGTFKLAQTTACKWQYSDIITSVIYEHTPSGTSLEAIAWPLWQSMFWDIEGACETSFENAYQFCPSWGYIKGFAQITFTG